MPLGFRFSPSFELKKKNVFSDTPPTTTETTMNKVTSMTHTNDSLTIIQMKMSLKSTPCPRTTLTMSTTFVTWS